MNGTGTAWQAWRESASGAAFDQVIAPLLSTARAQAARILGRWGDPDDAVQEALLRLLTLRAHLHPDADPAGILGNLVRWKALVQRRSARRRWRREACLPDDLTCAQSTEHLGLDAALAHLEPAQQELLRRRYVDGISLRVIAENLNLRPATVTTRLHQLRNQVQALLAAG